MQSKIPVNDIYIPYLENDSRIQIFYGGSSSGKSVFAAQRLVLDLLAGERNYLVCRAVARTIRKSVVNEIRKVISDMGVVDWFDINKSDGFITCKNGYQALFAGLDDVEKIKSITPEKGAITDIWIEEATETQRDDIKQLLKRQRGGDERTAKRLYMTFNPIYQNHWIYEDYFASIGWATDQTEYISPELSILKTWYIHNKFLTKQDIDGLLNERDEYYRNVYTFGNWGVLGDVIFTNWRIEDLSKMREQFTNRRHGLDFGFASHPAGISVSHYDNERKKIYIFDELYETGLTNDLLSNEALRMCGNERIIGDSAEPKSIAEMQQRGVSITGARKGKDSITFGIDWLKQHEIIIDKTCVNHIKEFQQYQWKKDANGNAVSPPKPIDKNNHLIDALRYAYEEDSSGGVTSIDNPFYN
jgi:phage terminase large subunit